MLVVLYCKDATVNFVLATQHEKSLKIWFLTTSYCYLHINIPFLVKNVSGTDPVGFAS